MRTPRGPGSSAGSLVGGVERIAGLRANQLRDLVMTPPALEALRSAYPSAELVLLGAPLHAELLAGRAGSVADRVVVVPFARGVREGGEEDPGALAAFLDSMRDQRFDLAVQLHGGGRWSNPFLRGLGAQVTVGSRAPDAEALDRHVPYVPFQHEVLRLLEVVALAGADPVTLLPRLPVTQADRVASRAAVPEGTGPLVVVHPGARDARRQWPADRFARLADALAERGARVVITGTLNERAAAEQVAAIISGLVSLGQGAASCFGFDGLEQMIVAMRRGLLLVASISDGSCIGVVARKGCDIGLVGYQMTLIVERAGAVLTPQLVTELKHEMLVR